MEPIQKIELPEWLVTTPTQKLMRLIGGDINNPQSLLVGGCVRNAVINGVATDIDVATKLTPEVVIEVLGQENIKTVPTGIEHGTITAVIDGQPFEITTLRTDVATDGRHAEVVFTDDWLEDVKRRDFTMNALLADLEGNVYDLTGQGVNDLSAGCVRFVGHPSERIAEDYLRILRFFRFFARYGAGEPDSEALKACKAAADNIKTLSRERITQEFFKILEADKSPSVLKTMFEHDVLNIFDGYKQDDLTKLILLQEKHNVSNAVSRFLVLNGSKARFHEDYFRLSHAQKNFLIKLEMAVGSDFYKNEKELKKAIYYHGNELLLQGYLLAVAKDEAEENAEMISLLNDWEAPKFPVTGEDLIKEGYQTGPELGQELERRREEWLDSVI